MLTRLSRRIWSRVRLHPLTTACIEAISRFAGRPAFLELNLVQRIRAARGGGDQSALMDFLISKSAVSFSTLKLVHEIGSHSRRCGRFDAFRDEVERLIAGGHSVRFRQFDLLHNFDTKSDPELARLLARLKFAGTSVATEPERLFECAEVLAARLQVNKVVFDYLYSHSRFKHMPRRDWEHHVRTAYAVLDLFRDCRMTWAQLALLLDKTARREIAERLNGMDGSILLVCHAGFLEALVAFADHDVEKLVYFGRGGGSRVHDRIQPVTRAEARVALFKGVKALREGRHIFIGSDGQVGNVNTDITVLGRSTRIADGAAFLAYESGRATNWFSVQRENDRFVPTLESGPRREPSESYKEFLERFRAFYELRVNLFFSGPPQDLYIPPRWFKIFVPPK